MTKCDQNEEAVASRATRFATTHWSVVLAAGSGNAPQADAALGKLCRAYWYPLYAYAVSA